jgi:hypothetical protein
MIVGLYDPKGQIVNEVRAYVGDQLIVVPSHVASTAGDTGHE